VRHGLAAALLALGFVLVQSAAAQDESPRVVPVEKAPFHVPTFHNEYVTMLRVNIPPGRTSGYHKHSLDMATVLVEGSTTRTQVLGSEPAEGGGTAGRVNFNFQSRRPLIHQVANTGASPYHIVGFEFMYAQPGRFSPSTRAEAPAYAQVLDNERVRAWRIVLAPGQAVPAITQTAPGIRVVVKGGELVESVPVEPDRGMSLRLGDFFWQDAGATRAIRNAGTTPIELVEFELK
jgi:quercetin dioxygenase-like cupin family protein